MPSTRALLLLVVVVLLAFGIWFQRRSGPPGAPLSPSRLAYVATADQLGPVGYRDPVGAPSPDGQSIAYAEGRHLRVQPIGGGPVVEFPPTGGQIRFLTWHADGRTVLAEDTRGAKRWMTFDVRARTAAPLWPTRDEVEGRRSDSGEARRVAVNALRQPSWSPDGTTLAAFAQGDDGAELWRLAADGSSADVRLATGSSFPAWTPDGALACLTMLAGKQRITLPCGTTPIGLASDIEAYGPFTFSRDGRAVYFGSPNQSGTLDLWRAEIASGTLTRLTAFSRDTYAPEAVQDGRVMFKVQSYRTFVADAPAEGGATRPLATFQSETPSYDPTGRWLGITYGSWRRAIDDFNYPDIAQEAGIIPADGAEPARDVTTVVDASVSEDQSLCWSPNGRWIAYHTHKEQSDDIWLRAAEGDAAPRRISFLGRGAETGWPRWSPDGRWVSFDGEGIKSGRSAAYVVGIDQETGATTEDPREVEVTGLDGHISHVEWLPDSRTLAGHAVEAPGRHAIFTVPMTGGAASVVHRFTSEHDFPGLAVSPDGRWVAFIAPGAGGYFQVHRLALTGGAPVQVTTDPTHKTQPAWSPDGRRLAFTVWSYQAHFWLLQP